MKRSKNEHFTNMLNATISDEHVFSYSDAQSLDRIIVGGGLHNIQTIEIVVFRCHPSSARFNEVLCRYVVQRADDVEKLKIAFFPPDLWRSLAIESWEIVNIFLERTKATCSNHLAAAAVKTIIYFCFHFPQATSLFFSTFKCTQSTPHRLVVSHSCLLGFFPLRFNTFGFRDFSLRSSFFLNRYRRADNSDEFVSRRRWMEDFQETDLIFNIEDFVQFLIDFSIFFSLKSNSIYSNICFLVFFFLTPSYSIGFNCRKLKCEISVIKIDSYVSAFVLALR